ncbi:MAG TPA: RMD1 family protein [bacterium]|nr:RMD1 family protein [bacterium]
MAELSIDATPRYFLHAYHLAETLKLKEIDRLFDMAAKTQSSSKLVYQDGEDRYFFVYRFGSITFFNVEPERQRSVLERVKMLLSRKPEALTSEEFVVELSQGAESRVGFERAVLGRLTLERIELLAFVLAQSTALERFEIKVEDLVRRAGDIGRALKEKGRLDMSPAEVKRFIGRCISTNQELVASLYLLDKPDETWNDESLDALYREAAAMFELRDRYKTLDYKLRMIQENLELISELLQYRNANSLSMAIIILIAVNIALFLMELFVLR